MLAALIPLLAPLVESLVGLIPNDNEREAKRAELNAKLLEIAASQAAQQVEINKVEAANQSVFVSGWRPYVGWVCAAGLTYQFLVMPLLPWIVKVIALAVGGHAEIPPLPNIDNESLMVLLTGMLGLGAFRSFEKIKGVASK